MAGLANINLDPRHKRWLLWGLAIAALAVVVILFEDGGGGDDEREATRQDNIQGILDEDTRELSIGTLDERLQRQREENEELSKTVSRLSDQLAQMEERQERVDELEQRNKELLRQLEGLEAEVSDVRDQERTAPEPPVVADDSDEQQAPEPEDNTQPVLDTHEAFEQEPEPAPADGDDPGDDTSTPSAPEIRTVGAASDDDGEQAPAPEQTIHNYLQTGSVISGRLLSGLDAPTNQGARENTVPVTLRVKKNAVLPNRYRSDVRECFVLLEGYGELSSERVKLRANTLSCVRDNESVLEVPLRAYAVDKDGKAGLRGRLVSKQGAVLARSMVSGFASGVSEAFDQSPVPTLQTSPGGEREFQSPNLDAAGESGAVQGASQALSQVAEFYLNMAEEMFPVLEVNPGRPVDLVITNGTDLRTGADDERAESTPDDEESNDG